MDILLQIAVLFSGSATGAFIGVTLRPVIAGWWENRRPVKHHVILCKTAEEYHREIAKIFTEEKESTSNTVIQTEGAV